MVASTPILYLEPWASLSALSESTILARDTPVALDSPSMRETPFVDYPAAPHTHTAPARVSLLWLIPSIGTSLAWHHIIIDLAHEFGVPIENFKISRSHRVGRQVPGKTRPILVKFIGYRPRERLFNIRKDIKAKYPTVDIFEDLTAVTAQLSYNARQLRRAGEIYQTWVRDGKVFVVLNHGGRAHLVHDEDALHDLVPQPQPEGAYGMTYHTQTPQTRPPSRSRSFIEGNTQQLRPQSSVGEHGQTAMTSSSAFAEPTNMPQSPLTALSGIACHESGGPPRSSPNPASNRSRGPSTKFSQHSEALQSHTAASESSPAWSSPRAAGRRQALSLASQFKKLPRSPHMSTPPPCSPTSSKNGSAGLQKITQYTKTLSMSSPHHTDRHSNPSIPEITLEPPTPSRVTGEDEATPGPTDDPLNELNDRDLNSSSNSNSNSKSFIAIIVHTCHSINLQTALELVW